ncbi:MAG: transporter substrate-binding domain-containing protein [Alphaproteobacteria bacterium]|nr:transporter substrate-binding domain-containing protein [Alphaproteobacteria bacterium]
MLRIFISLIVVLLSCSAYAAGGLDRIEKSGAIRCGYVVWPPYINKDPNTGEMSGLSYEYMSALARELDLKLEWAEEVGWGNFQEGLNANRFDVMCVPVWQSGQRARAALLTRPIYLNGLFGCSRANDKRFDKTLDSVNKPDIKIAYVENDVAQKIKESKFPLSSSYALPEFSDPSHVVLSVATGKADVSLCDLDNLDAFNKNNKTKLKAIAGQTPIRSFASVMAVKKGESDLKFMLDSAIDALEISGEAQSIVAPYAPTFMPYKQ